MSQEKLKYCKLVFTLTIFVACGFLFSCAEKELPDDIIISPSIINANAEGGAYQIDVKCSKSWYVESNNYDAIFDTYSGEGDGSINLTVYENTEITEDVIEAIFISGTAKDTLKIIRSGLTPVLDITNTIPKSVEASGDTINIDLSCNTNWTVQSNKSWAKTDKSSGSKGQSNLNLYIDKTEQFESEEVILTFKAASLEKELKLIRNGHQAFLTWDRDGRWSIPNTGGEIPLTIKSNLNWSLTSSAEWLTLSATSGKGNAVVMANVKPNTTIEDDVAVVSLRAENIERRFELVRKGAPVKISLNSMADIVFYNTGGETELTLSCNGPWTVKANANWLSIKTSTDTGYTSESANTGNSIVKIKALPSTLSEIRSSSVVFSSKNSLITIFIRQQKTQLPDLEDVIW